MKPQRKRKESLQMEWTHQCLQFNHDLEEMLLLKFLHIKSRQRDRNYSFFFYNLSIIRQLRETKENAIVLIDFLENLDVEINIQTTFLFQGTTQS